MPFEKIVRRVPVDSSLDSNLVGLIDLIEIELGLSSGEESVRTRLSELASQLQDGREIERAECLGTLLDAVARLKKIEEYMYGYGFETVRPKAIE